MKRALWIATKLFVFGLCIWVWYEIDAIEAGMIHGGRAQVAVVAITVIGVIVLSPVEPTAEWMGKKKMMINIGGIGAAAGLEAPAVRAQPQQAGAMKLAAMPSAMATVLAALLIVAPVLVGCSITSQGTMKYPKGETYTGALKDGIPNGQGTYKYYDGSTYTGEFKDGLRNGQGQGTFMHAGTTYTGEFKDGKANGQGTETYPNGFKYAGEFKDGKANGQGTLTTPDGTTYTGEFKDGKWHGQGPEY